MVVVLEDNIVAKLSWKKSAVSTFGSIAFAKRRWIESVVDSIGRPSARPPPEWEDNGVVPAA